MKKKTIEDLVLEAEKKPSEELQKDLKGLVLLLALCGGDDFVDLKRRATWTVLAGRGVEPCLRLDGSKNPEYSNSPASPEGSQCG